MINDDDNFRRNRTVAWLSLVLGVASGLLLGLWSFGGPVDVPVWLGDYDSVSRRLVRLCHISFFGLGVLNLLVAHELPRCSLQIEAKQTALIAMNVGNILLPLTLLGAAIYQPVKYAMGLPGLSVALALTITAWGVTRHSSNCIT